MKFKDKIGLGITNFIYPYMQNITKYRGDSMPRAMLEYEEYDLTEKKLWFVGNEDLLADFYNTRVAKYTTIDTRKSFYYSNVGGDIRVVHSGLPASLSKRKTDLVFSNGVENVVIADNDMPDEDNTERLEAIYADNDIQKRYEEMGQIKSWAGSVAVKVSKDTDVSDMPILEVYEPLQYKAIYKRNRIHEIVFIEEYENDYELHEIRGWGYIRYKLYKNNGTSLTEVSLNEVPYTADLEDEEFDSSLMLAIELQSVSDYKGNISEFDALDELWSQYVDEIRKARAITYVPDELMDGHKFDQFRKTYVKVGTSLTEDAKGKLEHDQPNIRTDEYVKGIEAVRNNILANAGLSPITIGVNDNVGSNASGEAIEKREIVSIRTRNNAIREWEPFLEDLGELVLRADDYFFGTAIGEYVVETLFAEYIAPSFETKVETVTRLTEADIIDSEKALDELYPDMDAEEKERIKGNVGLIAIDAEIGDEDAEDEE